MEGRKVKDLNFSKQLQKKWALKFTCQDQYIRGLQTNRIMCVYVYIYMYEHMYTHKHMYTYKILIYKTTLYIRNYFCLYYTIAK